jgi:GT2 family glycosyltransferase
MVDTSIIILNYNGKKYLRGCLKSILNQEGDFEVIFVDNCSTDDSVPYVQRRYANEISNGRMKLIITDRNYGFAEGNNIGYKVARGKYVVLVNNDVIVPQGWLKEVTSPLRNHKDIYLVGTAYYDKGFKKEWEQKLFKDKISNTINLSGEVISIPRVTYEEAHLSKSFYVSGNGIAMRRREITQPFDPDYFAYAEDTYLGWLAQLQGRKVVIDLKATMVHVGGGTKKNANSSFRSFALFHGHKNQMMNYLLFYEWKNVIRVFPIFIFTQLGHVVDNPRKITIKAKAYWWILTHLRAIIRKRKSIQVQRKVPDREIISTMSGKFFDEKEAELLYNATYQRIVRAANWLSLAYCRIVRLKVIELQGAAPKSRTDRAPKPLKTP